jgi:hypothetical protein
VQPQAPTSSPPATPPSGDKTAVPPAEAAILSKVFGAAKPTGLSGLLHAAVQQQQQQQQPQPQPAPLQVVAPQGKLARVYPLSSALNTNFS